ncbi:MAG: phosphotransferase family protein [Halobacteriales archaeon]
MTDAGEVGRTAALDRYFRREFDTRVSAVELLHDGLNRNALVTTASGDRLVVRRPTAVRDSPLFLDIEQEYRLLGRLHDGPLPVPEPIALCSDPNVLGERFAVLAHRPGRPVHTGERLPTPFRTPAARGALVESVIECLASVHETPVVRVRDVCPHLDPTAQVRIALDRLAAVERTTDLDVDRLEAVGNRLVELAPRSPAEAFVHGDFRTANLLFDASDDPTVTAVLDWETAMVGDPLTELGYLLVRWHDPSPPPVALDAMLASVDDAVASDVRRWHARGLDPFTAEAGSPDRRALITLYEAATGRTVVRPWYYLAHAGFMLATVWADLHRHRLARDEPSNWPVYVDYLTAVTVGRLADAGRW